MLSEYKKIMVIEDDPMTREVIQRHLEREGFTVFPIENGKIGLQNLFEVSPDLVVLDINMPLMDGFTVCERIRELSLIPIIMLTARSEPEEIIKGLELGADDYITKPFNGDVLIARVRANLRRADTANMPDDGAFNDNAPDYQDEHLELYFDQRRILIDGEQTRLSPTEFRLLELLIETSPRVTPYRNILETVWGFEYIDDINYLRVYIWHLRNKIELDPKDPLYIVNELGLGYRFEPQK